MAVDESCAGPARSWKKLQETAAGAFATLLFAIFRKLKQLSRKKSRWNS